MRFKLRTDWRWRKALELTARNLGRIEPLLKDLDDTTADVVRFKYDYDRGLGHRHPAYDDAAAIYFGHGAMRAVVEGSLLCGQDPESLQEVLGVPAGVCEAYHDTFFDVGDKLDNPGWISSVVFGGFAHDGASSASRREIGLRIAWLGGWELFHHFISGGFSAKEEQRLIGDVLTSVLGRRSIGMAFTAGNHPGSTEVIRTFADLAQLKELDAGDDDGGVADAGRRLIDQFRQRLLGNERRAPLVADIAEARKLELPTREPRESEYVGVGHE